MDSSSLGSLSDTGSGSPRIYPATGKAARPILACGATEPGGPLLVRGSTQPGGPILAGGPAPARDPGLESGRLFNGPNIEQERMNEIVDILRSAHLVHADAIMDLVGRVKDLENKSTMCENRRWGQEHDTYGAEQTYQNETVTRHPRSTARLPPVAGFMAGGGPPIGRTSNSLHNNLGYSQDIARMSDEELIEEVKFRKEKLHRSKQESLQASRRSVMDASILDMVTNEVMKRRRGPHQGFEAPAPCVRSKRARVQE